MFQYLYLTLQADLKNLIQLKIVLCLGFLCMQIVVHYVHQLAEDKKKDIFTGWAQNDLTEFLFFIIECMHNSISRPIHISIHSISLDRKWRHSRTSNFGSSDRSFLRKGRSPIFYLKTRNSIEFYFASILALF